MARITQSARLLQSVPLLPFRVGRVNRAHALLAEAPVHLVQVLADDLLLGLRDAPTVRLAGMLEAQMRLMQFPCIPE